MKKKLICIFLFVAMTFGTLVGCGTKETNSSNATIETEEFAANAETEAENDYSATSDIVVDDERPELSVVGTTTTMPWGSYTIVSSENGLDNVEIEFYEMTFKATVPQDMASDAEWTENTILKLYNKDKSKILMAWYSPITMEDKVKDDAFTEEEWRSFLLDSYTKDGYAFEKTWINENLLEVSFETNSINTKGKDRYGYAVFKMDFEKGWCYQFYYGEDVEICDADVVKIVAKSLDFLKAED